MGNIIAGLIIVIIGAVIAIKSEWLFRNFGTPEFAEKHLHFYGGGRLFYQLLGIIIILIGFLIMTGLIGNIIMSLFGRMFSGMAT